MFLDPDKLNEAAPADVLAEATRGHLGLDHRFLHAIVDRPAESLPAIAAFVKSDLIHERIDLSLDIAYILRYLNAPEGVLILIDLLKDRPDEVPDDVVYVLVAHAKLALEPLLKLHGELEETESGEVAFILANLGIHDPRILAILTERLEFDFSDTLLLLDMYHDPAVIPAIEKAAATLEPHDKELKEEVDRTIAALKEPAEPNKNFEEDKSDLWELYPEKADPPMDILDEDEREELLAHPVASIRAVAARSFFNDEISPSQQTALLKLAETDPDANVRGRAWEALIEASDKPEVVNAMLAALRKTDLPVVERGGLLVGLAPEADRNEVRKAFMDFYDVPAVRAKALEAMWRSLHKSFQGFFAPHLEDKDIEVRRAALWGAGYYGLKSELGRIRAQLDDHDLREDALFAYSLAIPSEVSRGRMKGLLERITKDAGGLSEMEEELVKAALDERLLLAGKEPVFRGDED